MDDLRYPIGPFQPPLSITGDDRREYLAHLEQAPALLRLATAGLWASQLDTPYRPAGWTVRQVVHHLADSHLNWFVRTRLALTEDDPVVTPWDENRWAGLEDARSGPIEPSLLLLEGLHQRWAALFRSLSPAELGRTLRHPERGTFTLEATLPMHAWHGRHHTAQIAALRKRMGWQSCSRMMGKEGMLPSIQT
ncbi:MAG: YfiT family bacillithiol transferase [Bryobacteraceae bacterium]